MRYLLQTDILPRLLERAEVVVMAQAPGPHLDALAARGVAVEVVPQRLSDAYALPSFAQQVLRQVRVHVYGARTRSGEILWQFSRDKVRAQTRGQGLRGVWRRARQACYGLTARVLSRWRALRRLLLWLESRIFCPTHYDAVFARHRPDLVVVSSLGTFDYDQLVMRAAHKHRVPVAAIVLSWDNTTTRGYPGARADHVVVWTETMKREAVELHDCDPARVFVGGVAHFDAYHRPDPGFERAAFLRSLGADPARRMLFVATRSPNSYPWNPAIAEALAAACRSGKLAGAQVVVRIHPLHYRRTPDGGLVYADVLAAYDRLAAQYPAELVLNVPRFVSEGDAAMPEEEMAVLGRLMRACDVIVTVFSTINIEGSILERPLVNVCFEGRPRPDGADAGEIDLRTDSELVHNARVVRSGGVAVATSLEQMVAHVADYLADPGLRRAGRRAIVEAEAGPFHGDAGRTIADHLLGLVERA